MQRITLTPSALTRLSTEYTTEQIKATPDKDLTKSLAELSYFAVEQGLLDIFIQLAVCLGRPGHSVEENRIGVWEIFHFVNGEFDINLTVYRNRSMYLNVSHKTEILTRPVFGTAASYFTDDYDYLLIPSEWVLALYNLYESEWTRMQAVENFYKFDPLISKLVKTTRV